MRKFNISLLIACLIGGIIGWAVSEIVYKAFNEAWNPIVMTGVYFAILVFFIALPGILTEWATNHLSGYAWDGAVIRRTFGFLITGTISLFLIGALLQFLYGLSKTSDVEMKADDYIIIIDNSGSTSATDPYSERFSAVVQFIDGLDTSKKVMISIFSDTNKVVLPLTQAGRDLAKQAEGIFSGYESFGGTDIQNALTGTLQEYPASNRAAIVILFSDGESDVDLIKLADTYKNAGINIYTIGFSMQAYEGRTLLESIALETGGAYYEINEMTDFSSALTEIASLNVRRSLLSYRDEAEKGSILYIILRVVFILLISMLMEPVFGLIFDSEEILISNIPIRAVISLITGIMLEACLYLSIKDNIPRLVMSILMSLIFTHYHASGHEGKFNSGNEGALDNTNINRNTGFEIGRNNYKKAPSDIYTFSNKNADDQPKNKSDQTKEKLEREKNKSDQIKNKPKFK